MTLPFLYHIYDQLANICYWYILCSSKQSLESVEKGGRLASRHRWPECKQQVYENSLWWEGGGQKEGLAIGKGVRVMVTGDSKKGDQLENKETTAEKSVFRLRFQVYDQLVLLSVGIT